MTVMMASPAAQPYSAQACDESPSANASSTNAPRRPPLTFLTCTLASDACNDDDDDATCRPPQQRVLRFRPDESKKAAHWIDPPPAWCMNRDDNPDNATVVSSHASEDAETENERTVPAPAHCTIECVVCEDEEGSGSLSAQPPATFFLGGFQLVSNAKSVEVVADGTYLTTCRGLPSRDHPPGHFKVLYAIPGGPRLVRSVVLQLRTTLPEPSQDTTRRSSVARLVSMKLTARLPEPVSPPTDASSTSSLVAPDATTSLPSNPHSPPGDPLRTAPAPRHSATIHASGALSSLDASMMVSSSALPSPPSASASASASAAAVAAGTDEEQRLASIVAAQIHTALAPLEQHWQLFTTTVVEQLQSQNQLLEHQRALLEAQTREIRDLRQVQECLLLGGHRRLQLLSEPSPGGATHLAVVSEAVGRSAERDATPEDTAAGPSEERADCVGRTATNGARHVDDPETTL